MPKLYRLRLIAALTATLISFAGCGETPPPGGDPLPGPVATATRDGLIVTLALDHAALTAGARAWAKVTILNTAPVVRHYQGGGCNFLTDITIRTAAAVAPERGRDWDGMASFFKNLILPNGAPDANAFFVDERFLDQGGEVACPADLGVNEIKPGERLEMKAAWSGEVQGVPATSGPARIVASFPYLGPANGGEMLGRQPQPIQAAIDVDVTDGGVRLLSPGLAIDAALANPGFAGWLAASPRSQWQGVLIESRGRMFDVILDSGTQRGTATVDRATGVVTFAKRPHP